MSRLPTPGADNGTWGDILNDFLSQIHTADGSLKDNIVTSAAIAPNAVDAVAIADGTITNTLVADGTIQEAKLSSAVQSKLNMVAGTPDWADITNKPAVIAAGTDQASARAAIGAGTSDLAIGTTGTTAKAGNYTPTKSDVGLANVDNTSDANKPISAATQTALDGKAASVHTHTATQISDSTATGRSLVTAVDAATAKSVLSITKTDVGLANVNNTSDLNKPVSTATQTALDAKADLVGGVIPTAQLPSLAFNTAVTVVSQAAMLALNSSQVQPGDLAIRSDGAGTFILTGADPSQLSNWTLLDSPTAPVTSVNSQTGNVVLGKADIGLNNVDNTSDINKPISSATQTALDDKADLVGGVIPSSQLPSISLNTVVTVANQAAMLALTTTQVQPGDIAVRSDGAGSFILTATDPSVLGNWTLLAAPADAVTSVNSQTGAIVLSKSDIGLGNVDNTSDASKNSAAAALTNKTISFTSNTITGLPYDLNLVAFLPSTVRAASSYGDFAPGVKFQRSVTLTSVIFRCNTADASGNLVVELRKNGSTLSGSSTSIAAANQTTGGSATGTWTFEYGDILTVYITGVGTSPGSGLVVDILGTADAYASPLAPTWGGISPSSAKTDDTVTITGTHFLPGTTVTIGGVSATNITVVNSTTITCTVPTLGSAGPHDVVVTTAAGSCTGTAAFTYYLAPTYSNVSPVHGQSGDTVTITGTRFDIGTASVTIGGSAATSVNVVNSTTITCVVPSLSNGLKTVVVTTSGGSAQGTNAFEYFAAVTETNTNRASVSVPAFTSGVWVTLVGAGGGGGTGFGSASSVNRFGGAGGGGGGRIPRFFIPVASLGATYSVTRGLGATTSNGTASTMSSGSISLSAGGGTRGNNGSTSAPSVGSGGTCSISGVSTTSHNGANGGAAGSSGTSWVGVAGGNSTNAGAGGGGGGSVDSGGTVAGHNGGDGGNSSSGGTLVSGGNGGTAAGGGAPGNSPGSQDPQVAGGAGAGGGGARASNTNGGADGGSYGGGGSGGGGVSTAATSAGSAGGDGYTLLEWV